MKNRGGDALGGGHREGRRTGAGRWLLRVGLFGALLVGAVSAETTDHPPPLCDPLAALPPFPSLVEFAAAHRIPIRDIEFAGEPAASRPGDRVTLLVALQRAGAERQWLLGLTAGDLTVAERQMKPPADAVIFTSTGLELRFVNSRTALDVYLAGPFTGNAGERRAALAETHARVLVSSEYLTAGFGRFGHSALEVGARMRAAGLKQVAYATQGQAFSTEDLKTGKDWAAKVMLTPDEERWENEAYFALVAFFETARSLPAFREIADPVLALPSLWSLATHFGFSTRLVFQWPEVETRVTPVAAESYQFPLNVWFNQTLGARARLVVTPPRPPLEVCAGIVAICAEHPADRDQRLFIRLVAARSALPSQTKFENAH